MPLNAKQERFVTEYMLDTNGTQAAIRAGYAANSAAVTASRLLRNANVGQAVAERTLAVAEKAAVLRTTRLLERRLEPGDLERFQALLDTVPDVEPEDYDQL